MRYLLTALFSIVAIVGVSFDAFAADTNSKESTGLPSQDRGDSSVRLTITTPQPKTLYPLWTNPTDTVRRRTAAQMGEMTLSNHYPEKPKFSGKPNVPAARRQGGERLADALQIQTLPFFDEGTTNGYADDYDEACPNAPGSPDVVYSFAPDSAATISIALCNSYYDTRLWVYMNDATPGTAIACNDDYCGLGSYVVFSAQPGNTYYIVVDGFGGDYGEYAIEVLASYPLHLECPPNSVAEDEPCVYEGTDTHNGGCNLYPPQYGTITPQDTICGTSWGGPYYRDTDWYLKTFTGDTMVTWKAVGGFPVQVNIINLTNGCDNRTSRYNYGDAGDTVAVSWRISAGTYAFFVAPAAYTSDNNCTSAASQYFAWMECSTPPPPPVNDRCENALPISDVSGLEFSTLDATWDGYGYYYETPDIWYCYTATCNGEVTIDLCDVDYDAYAIVWNGCTCPPTSFVETYYTNCYPGGRIRFAANAGQSYLLQIGGGGYYYGASGTGRMSVQCHPAPPETFCENVVPRTLPATFTGDATGALRTCSSLYGKVVWAAFTISSCMNVYIDYCGTQPVRNYNAYVALTDACPCGSFRDADRYEWYSCPDGNLRAVWYSLKPGTYYYPILYDEYYGMSSYNVTISGDTTVCDYCAATSLTCDEHIARVQLNDLDNSSGCDHYMNYRNLTARVYRGIDNQLVVTNGSNMWADDNCNIWIDWNRDLDFDDYQESYWTQGSPGYGPYLTHIYVPEWATDEPVTMRAWISYGSMWSSCGASTYGEVEDYTLVIDEFVCGDANGDHTCTTQDLDYLIAYYNDYGPSPVPWQACDANCDGILDIADIEAVVQLLSGVYYPWCCPPETPPAVKPGSPVPTAGSAGQ